METHPWARQRRGCGYRCVYRRPSGWYEARLLNPATGRRECLGTFESPELAALFVDRRKSQIFPAEKCFFNFPELEPRRQRLCRRFLTADAENQKVLVTLHVPADWAAQLSLLLRRAVAKHDGGAQLITGDEAGENLGGTELATTKKSKPVSPQRVERKRPRREPKDSRPEPSVPVKARRESPSRESWPEEASAASLATVESSPPRPVPLLKPSTPKASPPVRPSEVLRKAACGEALDVVARSQSLSAPELGRSGESSQTVARAECQAYESLTPAWALPGSSPPALPWAFPESTPRGALIAAYVTPSSRSHVTLRTSSPRVAPRARVPPTLSPRASSSAAVSPPPVVQRQSFREARAPALQQQNRVAGSPALQRQNRVAGTPTLQRQNRITGTPALQRQNRITGTPALQQQNRIAGTPAMQQLYRDARALVMEIRTLGTDRALKLLQQDIQQGIYGPEAALWLELWRRVAH